MTYAYRITGALYCPDCVVTNGDLAQADAKAVTDPSDVADVDVDGDPLEERVISYRCVRCGESLYHGEEP
jgi:hypothetical protein